MNWRDKTVIRILMVVAKLIARAEWQKEVENLAIHLSVNIPDEPKAVVPDARETQAGPVTH